MTLPEMLGQAFGDVDGAVLAAGAADRDGEVAAIGLDESAMRASGTR